ncbi:MAG: glycoside hydrolase family 88 protein [Anaerolineales bacterium]|nr:glycoside hydrolase family 88 protein [Anaerolineales bacterium]
MANMVNAPSSECWSVRITNSVLRRFSADRTRWHYEEGLVVKALADTAAVTGDDRLDRFVRDWVDLWVTPDGDIRTYRMEEFNLDQVSPGRLLFPVLRQTGEPRYRKAIERLREQLRRQPRTRSGGFWHKQIYPHQMWLDGMYMAGPFYAEYASLFGDGAAFDDIAAQVALIEKHTRDPKTGLLYHGWDESRQQRWASPESGCSPNFWGRGMGWFAMAIVDLLDYFPPGHGGRLILAEIFQRTAEAVARVQDPESGMWFQVLDQAGIPGNYRESSASAMFAYAFAKGVRINLLSSEYETGARKAFRGLVEHQVRRDTESGWSLNGICSVAGLGGEPYRDGSYRYYTEEKVATNDPKGVGAFILAALELEAADSRKRTQE